MHETSVPTLYVKPGNISQEIKSFLHGLTHKISYSSRNFLSLQRTLLVLYNFNADILTYRTVLRLIIRDFEIVT